MEEDNKGMDNKGIFVSYRRDDATAHAGWLAEKLADRFGRQNVFRDIGSIEPGEVFPDAIESALELCAVMLVVIGRSWATKLAEREQAGQEDYTRLEVSTALKRDDVRVIPVLVQGASMPSDGELPDDLSDLRRRQAITLHDTNWESDIAHLTTGLERRYGWQKEQPTGDKEASEVAAGNIRETISDFLEFIQQRRIWEEDWTYREIADPEKMRESVEAIRANLTNPINIVRRENYAHLDFLTEIQDACLPLLDALDRNRRRLKQAPDFGDREFFAAVYPQLDEFQLVVVERCRDLCEDQNLWGESPCRKFR